MIGLMCVGRPGAAGGDFLPKSDFGAEKCTFCKKSVKIVNYVKKSVPAPRGPEGGGVHTFLLTFIRET